MNIYVSRISGMTQPEEPFMNISKKLNRPVSGAVLAGLALILCCILKDWQAGVIFAGLFLAAGFLKIPARHPVAAFGLNALWGIVCIFISCALPSALYEEAASGS